MVRVDEARRAAHRAEQERSHAAREVARKAAIEAGELEAFELNLALAKKQEAEEKERKRLERLAKKSGH